MPERQSTIILAEAGLKARLHLSPRGCGRCDRHGRVRQTFRTIAWLMTLKLPAAANTRLHHFWEASHVLACRSHSPLLTMRVCKSTARAHMHASHMAIVHEERQGQIFSTTQAWLHMKGVAAAAEASACAALLIAASVALLATTRLGRPAVPHVQRSAYQPHANAGRHGSPCMRLARKHNRALAYQPATPV